MRILFLVGFGLLAGCAQVSDLTGKLLPPEAAAPDVSEAPEEVGDPLAAPLSVEPLPDEPVKPPVTPPEQAAAASGKSGTTVVSLGDPARGGAWMETTLVSAEQAGQVHYGGKGVDVTLLPSEGGSRMSLQAMQALGLPLGDLTEVKVVY